MKFSALRIVCIVTFLLGSLGLSAQMGPKLEFEEMDYDFGEVEMGTVVEKVYRFYNVGDLPLDVTKAKAGCGCTKVEFEAVRLNPGEWGSLKMIFDTDHRLGKEKNSVTVWSSDAYHPHKLTFHGVIIEPEKAPETEEKH